MKLKQLLSVGLCLSLLTVPAFAVNKTLTLREDWRLTSELDLKVAEGGTLTIDGQNKFYIYEMGGTLQNSDVGTVTFSNTILYPSGNDWKGTSDQLMTERQPHTVTVADGIVNGTVVIASGTDATASVENTSTKGAAKTGTTVTLTVTPSSGYELETLTVKDANNADVAVTGSTFTMPAANVTVIATFQSTGSSSSGSSSSNSTTTTTEKNPDGSTTTTVTDKATGTVTETTKNTDGSTTIVKTTKDGTVTITDTATNGVKTVTVSEPGKDVAATVTLPSSVGSASVTIPVEATSGIVAMDAETGEIIKLSIPDENGLTVVLDNSAQLILVDNSKDFSDTGDHWAEDAIDFVTARELFNGTSAANFSPDVSMSRGMIAVVLHNFENNPDHTFTGAFADVNDGAWYSDGIRWAADLGIVGGYGDGAFGPEDSITREQLAAILYRYAMVMDYDVSASASLNGFSDSAAVSGYAADALQWAVGSGLISGMDDGTLAPQGNATRAQVASILMRFCEHIVQ